MEEELQSPPSVQRHVVPSPIRGTPSPSKKNISAFYVGPVPPFVLEALDQASDTEIVDLPRHYLPDYSFRLVDGHLSPTGAQLLELAPHFPGCSGIAYTPPFLVVSWVQLPVKPWPLTVDRLPLFYADPENPRPPTCGRAGGSKSILNKPGERLKLWEAPGMLRTKKIAESLIEQGIGLRFFGWGGVRWYSEVTSFSDGLRLPSTICGLLVSWELHVAGEESSRRITTPMAGRVVDRSSYTPALRPSMCVASDTMSSTSGIPLLGPDGSRWVTVAKHSFPMEKGDVHHPCYSPSKDMVIATLEYSFPNSDIGLAKLSPEMKYSATSFDADDANGTTFVGLIGTEDIRLCQLLYLDSPYNGKCEGLVTSTGFCIIPTGSTNGPFQYIECNMLYFGDGSDEIFDGTCGSALWTSDNEVAGFFRWYHTKGAIAFAPSVNVLISSGYKLEAID